jgi:putative oxidoreductase
MNLGRLIARGVIGGLFVGHGTQKLFGWFGGPGLEGTSGMMDRLELSPGKRHALAASIAETAGGSMLVLGALTPLAGALITGSMVTAIRKVHFSKGLWNQNGGYEFNLALIGAVAALVDGGPGRPSVDSALGIDDTGSGWAVASVAAGVVGSTIAIEAGKRHGQEQERQEQPFAAPETAATPAVEAVV